MLAHAPADRPYLIAIDGLAGSGKTTFTTRFARELERTGVLVAIVTLDGGFWVDRGPTSQGAAQSEHHAGPSLMLEDYDWKRLKSEVLDPLRNGAGVSAFSAYTVVIVEGCFTLRKETEDSFDLKIFVHMPQAESLRRAIERDGRQSLEYYMDYWQKQEDFYVRNHRPLTRADLVIDGRGPADAEGWPLALRTAFGCSLEPDTN